MGEEATVDCIACMYLSVHLRIDVYVIVCTYDVYSNSHKHIICTDVMDLHVHINSSYDD